MGGSAFEIMKIKFLPPIHLLCLFFRNEADFTVTSDSTGVFECLVCHSLLAEPKSHSRIDHL